jgi:hypothetical protein
MTWLAYARLSCRLCESACLGGLPWWLYRCSQLGFTNISCLLLQVKVLGSAGFVYPSSGLLPWQEPGRQISRTEGSYPRHYIYTRVTIGDGKRAVFWHSTWIGSSPLCLQFLDIYKMLRRKNKTVALAVPNNSWVTDLGNHLMPHQLQEFIQLWRLVRHASSSFDDDWPDSIRWILTADGCYSTKSAYNVQFVGR